MKNPEISHLNLDTRLLAKYRSTIYSNTTWHKIEVENAIDLEKNAVLRTFMNFVHPLDFIPVCYEVKGSSVSFLLKNCGAAIEKLCKHNLIVTNPQDTKKPFKIKIILKFASATDLKINIQSNIINILNKRFNSESGVLDLEMFYKDPELTEFCTLSQPKLMFYVLHLARTELKKPLKSIKLSNNEIEVLKPLEALFNLKTITSLDLRNNKIKEIDVSNFKSLRLTELWLDGNPICDDYDEYSYPKTLRDMIPTLQKLDGFSIQNKGLLSFRRNFLCSSLGHDLVDQFLGYYFDLYDSRNRRFLEGIYHEDAMFSMTYHYLGFQSTSVTTILQPYKLFARNLKTLSDYSKSEDYLFQSRNLIIKLLTSLPATEHDPYSFTVDLMSHTEMASVLVISGVFRQVPENLLEIDRLFGFSRVFVLLAGENNEYLIVNEQLHVYNATSSQALRAFKSVKSNKLSHIEIPLPKNIKEKGMLAEAFVGFTGLNIEWATKCLEEYHYDLKRSLELFVELFKLDKIPTEAFRSITSGENKKSKTTTCFKSTLNSVSETETNKNVKDDISSLETKPKIKVKDFASSNNFLEDKEQDPKKNESQGCDINKDKEGNNNDKEVESINLFDDGNDDCIIIDHEPTENKIFLPLPPNCKKLPCEIIEDYEPFIFPKIIDQRIPKIRFRVLQHHSALIQSLPKFDDEFRVIFNMCKKKPPVLSVYKESLPLALNIIKRYSYHIVAYQRLLLFYYPRHRSVAREFKEEIIEYVKSNQELCISLRILNVLIAECECAIGDRIKAEDTLKSLIIEYPQHLEAVKVYLRYLCNNFRRNKTKNNAIHYFRIFVNWVLNVDGINKDAIREMVKEYESLLNIRIIM